MCTAGIIFLAHNSACASYLMIACTRITQVEGCKDGRACQTIRHALCDGWEGSVHTLIPYLGPTAPNRDLGVAFVMMMMMMMIQTGRILTQQVVNPTKRSNSVTLKLILGLVLRNVERETSRALDLVQSRPRTE